MSKQVNSRGGRRTRTRFKRRTVNKDNERRHRANAIEKRRAKKKAAKKRRKR